MKLVCLVLFFFFFNDTATTEIYTLSLHDALPISLPAAERRARCAGPGRWPDGISTAAWHGGALARDSERGSYRYPLFLEQVAEHGIDLAGVRRSEERRVGKEGRSRWSPDHLKKKK